MLNPKVELPSYAVNDHWEIEYEPIKQFCMKHQVTLQGILSAMQTRAMWKYHEGKIDNMELGVDVPIDSRQLKCATDKYKKLLFCNSVCTTLMFVNKKETILEQIKHCQERMKENLSSSQPYDIIFSHCDMFNAETKKVTLPSNYPDSYRYNIVFASHLGRAPDRDDIDFGTFSLVIEFGYWPCLYAFHTSKKVQFTFVRPFNTEPKYFEAVKNSTIEVFDYIKQDISK